MFLSKRRIEIYFFLLFLFEVLLVTVFLLFVSALATDFLPPVSLARPDLILAALFLWMMPFLAVLSVILKAFFILASEGFLLACFKVFLKISLSFLFADSRFLSFLSFFLADFITGIAPFYHVILINTISLCLKIF